MTLPLAALIPVVDDVIWWVEHQVKTMDDNTYTLAIAGLVLVLALVMLGIRPRY
ncbi:MAG: hypothetical protein AB1941_03010 [Gemmatimonadota bacterium]